MTPSEEDAQNEQSPPAAPASYMKVRVLWAADGTTQNRPFEGARVTTQIFTDAPADAHGGRPGCVVVYHEDGRKIQAVSFASVYSMEQNVFYD